MKNKMKNIKCFCKDCDQNIEVPCDVKIAFCSIECACYAGYFSVTKGWIKNEKTMVR